MSAAIRFLAVAVVGWAAVRASTMGILPDAEAVSVARAQPAPQSVAQAEYPPLDPMHGEAAAQMPPQYAGYAPYGAYPAQAGYPPYPLPPGYGPPPGYPPYAFAPGYAPPRAYPVPVYHYPAAAFAPAALPPAALPPAEAPVEPSSFELAEAGPAPEFYSNIPSSTTGRCRRSRPQSRRRAPASPRRWRRSFQKSISTDCSSAPGRCTGDSPAAARLRAAERSAEARRARASPMRSILGSPCRYAPARPSAEAAEARSPAACE